MSRSSGVLSDSIIEHVTCGREIISDYLWSDVQGPLDACRFSGDAEVYFDPETGYVGWVCPECGAAHDDHR